MTLKIAAVDDDPAVLNFLSAALSREGHAVIPVPPGAESFERIRIEKPDVVILDRSMPEINGLDLCKRLKQSTETAMIPILMLSGKNETSDRVTGLEAGADDYLGKPFNRHELFARIKALARRKTVLAQAESTQCGPLHIDWGQYRVTLRGEGVVLRPKEFELLRVLVKSGGKVLSRAKIFEEIWGYKPSLQITTRTLDQHICHLRKKLASEGKRIRSVKDVGYRFEIT